MKKCLIISIGILAVLTATLIGKLSYPSSVRLNVDDYTSIERMGSMQLITSSKENVRLIVEFLNSIKTNKTIFWNDTLESPDVVISLINKDGIYENYDIFSAVNEDKLFIHFKNSQYKIKYVDDFIKKLGQLESVLGTEVGELGN